MKKFIIVIVIVIITAACSSLRQVQVVREVSRDTLYLSNVQYDSIYVYQDRLTDRSRDTIYIRDVQYEYKYKLLRDTVYRTQIDTIPIIREVEVVKTERYVPAIYKWSLALVIVFVIVIVFYFVWKIRF